MAKIAVIIEDLFEDSEYEEPVKAFKASGHDITRVGLEEGATVKGKKEGTEAKIDKALEGASAEEFDALLIPGGYSPDRLRAHPDAVNFARKFMEDKKPVFSICHGAQLLITADTLRGRKATGWKSIAQDIKNAGAEYRDSEVVVDGNLVTSRSPRDLKAFIRESLAKLDNI